MGLGGGPGRSGCLRGTSATAEVICGSGFDRMVGDGAAKLLSAVVCGRCALASVTERFGFGFRNGCCADASYCNIRVLSVGVVFGFRSRPSRLHLRHEEARSDRFALRAST